MLCSKHVFRYFSDLLHPLFRPTTSDLIAQESENGNQQHIILHLHCRGLSRVHHHLVQEHRAHHP